MKLAHLVSIVVPWLALAACSAATEPVEPLEAPASPEAPGGALRPGATLVLLKTGPQSGKLPEEENTRAFTGHFENMERMALARQLLVAGPYGELRHDPDLRGIFVLASVVREEAQRWAGTDPATQAGIFVLEFHDLVTDAPLAAALERDLARLERARAEGREPPPGQGARGYVLLTAESADRAERELAGLRSREGGVFLLARLDGTRTLAVLDAHDLDEASERFAPQLENLGAHVLDEWFATGELENLVE